MPFVLYPSTFPLPDEPIVGAATIHHLFKGWLAGVQRGDFPPPWQLPVAEPVSTRRCPRSTPPEADR